jgi:hypothetical protein
MEITTGISNKTGYGNLLVLVKSRLQVVHRLIQRACPFLTFRYLSVTYFDFGDRVTSYRRTGQFLRTNLVFVSSTIKRCIVPELALSTTAGTARTPGVMPTYDKTIRNWSVPFMSEEQVAIQVGCDESTLKS